MDEIICCLCFQKRVQGVKKKGESLMKNRKEGESMIEAHSGEEAVELEKKSPISRSAGKDPWSNQSLQGTFVGTANGTVPESIIGGDPNKSIQLTTLFKYTFDGKGNIDPAYGVLTGGGRSGLVEAKGTYSIDPTTGIGTLTIISTSASGAKVNRQFSLSDNRTQLHWMSIDPGFQFSGIMYKQ